MNATAPDHTELRKRYRALLRRQEAQALCAELGVGKTAFRRWCRQSPVEGKEFRAVISGYQEFRYYRDTILTACGGNDETRNQKSE